MSHKAETKKSKRTREKTPSGRSRRSHSPGDKPALESKRGEARENRDQGKRVRGVNKGSSLHLYSPENAVEIPSAFIVMEQGTPTVTAEIEGVRRDLIVDTG